MTVGIFVLAHESHIILSASRCSVIPIETAPPYGRAWSAPVTIPAMSSASAPGDFAAPQTQSSEAPRLLYYGLCFLLAATFLFFTRLGARALWSSEFRWAEIAREMLVTHNYFWPTINGHVYYDKPLGSYWLVLFSTPFTAGLNKAATRLPSAVAGLLAVLLL